MKIHITGIIMILTGIICFIWKAISPEYIDEAGVLHEQFFLLPAGYALIFIGCILQVIYRIKRKRASGC